MQRSFLSLVGIALLAIGLGACGSSDKTSAADTGGSVSTSVGGQTGTTASPAASGPTITISKSLMFSTAPVKAGATVTVRNDSDAQHTVTADTTAGGFDMTIDAGKTITFTAPSKPGVYGFHCNIHNFMKSKLTVT